MLDLSNIITQGNTRIIIIIQKNKFFIEGNVTLNLYPLLLSTSDSDVNLPFLSL